MTVSEQLRQAINSDPRTVHRLSLDAELSPIQVWRFLRGQRALRTSPAVDRLCKVLGLELKPIQQKARR